MSNIRIFLEKMVRVRRAIIQQKCGRFDRQMVGKLDRLQIELSRQNVDLTAWARRNRHMIEEIIPGAGNPHSLKWLTEFRNLIAK